MTHLDRSGFPHRSGSARWPACHSGEAPSFDAVDFIAAVMLLPLNGPLIADRAGQPAGHEPPIVDATQTPRHGRGAMFDQVPHVPNSAPQRARRRIVHKPLVPVDDSASATPALVHALAALRGLVQACVK